MTGPRTRPLRVLALMASLATTGASAQSGLDVSARLQPRVIGENELAYLSIEAKGDGIGGRGMEPTFELENFAVVSGPSTSTSFRLENGISSRSLTLSWVLRPQETGSGRVHSIEVTIGDRVFNPPDLEIEIQKGAVGRTERPDGRARDPFEDFFPPIDARRRRPAEPAQVFLRAEVEPKQPFVGQQALYTLYLFTQVDVTSINPERLPDFAGLWVREIEQPPNANLQMVDLDGKRFGKVAVLRRAIFPLRPGQVELEAARVQLTLRLPDRTFQSMFSRAEQVQRTSNAVTLDVRSLPTPEPPDFSGAVGDLKVAAELDPPELEIGDAATFSVTLSGAGHLQGLPAPILPEIPGLRSFPPQQESDERILGNKVHGRRTWSFVVVPEEPGEFELPAIDIPFFDPQRGAFRTAHAAATRLKANPSIAPTLSAVSAAVAEAAEAAQMPDETPTPPDWSRILPWGLVAALAAALAVALRNRGRGDSAHPRAAFQTAVRRAGHKSKPREAAALIEDAWREFLEARWNISPSTPSTQWGRRLSETGAPCESADRLVELADDLHYLRYAPQLSDTAALKKELILRSTKLARTLK